ncbi:MAG: glycosyltransferase, partial [Cyanobium sp.]
HAPIQLDTASPQPQLRTQVIPHGPYRYPAPSSDPAELRLRLAIPPQATLLLSFGHIRNNKNLQLTFLAMAELPELWLLVAGPEATAGQRPSAHYRQLAEQLAVPHRCRWQIGYQRPQQVADLFTASDAVLLTYSGALRSASGVLHLAAHYRKPMIASAGASALLDTVRTFNLGVVVPADDATALAHGIQHWLSHPPAPDWPGYESANSWARNAEFVAQALGLEPVPLAIGP